VTYRRKDPLYRKAKAEGFRARSAYKLAELDARYGLLRAGDRVVDLGAWPGGWLQIAVQKVGPTGRLVGIDVVAIEPLAYPNLSTIVGDVRNPDDLRSIRDRLDGAADVVLSDIAPKLTGIRDVDEARCGELDDAVLKACELLLRPGGRLLAKIFMTSRYEATIRRLREGFRTVRTTRADSSRRHSSELYVVGDDYRGGCG
jgi:23S rRNA (uridine2552-2'-O)-methyltransferase